MINAKNVIRTYTLVLTGDTERIMRIITRMRTIPFHKPYITKEEIDAVTDALKSGWLTIGPKTAALEKAFCDYFEAQNAISLNSCTAALHLSIKVIGIKQEDEVLIPAVNFASAGEVVLNERALPVLVDIEKETGNIDMASLESAISKKTKAIIPVHFGGQPCDMDEILEMAGESNIYVIEDCAHAIPSFYRGKKAGMIGDVGCFSFYATKTVTTGDGGMAITNYGEWSQMMRVLRLHGISKDAWKRYSDEGDWYYEIVELGYKYNMTDIQAAIGIEQLKKLEWMWHQREKIAETYISAFKDIPEIDLPRLKADRVTSWHLFPIFLRLESLTTSRNEFIEELGKRGIKTSVHFIPLYRHPYYRKKYDYKLSDFPNSEWFYEREISLPIFPSLEKHDQEYVIENVIEICKKRKR